MKCEILHRAYMRQTSSRWAKSHSFKLSKSGFAYYMDARRRIKKHGRIVELRIQMGERANVKGPYRHIHSLPLKPLRTGSPKHKLIHCDWAKIYARQAKLVKRQELEGARWIEQRRYDD